jgi:MFS family permease
VYGEPLLASNFYDDGYYYLKIAKNIAAGYGSTFDGISQTNGYQPLWMAILLPFVFLFHPATITSGLLLLFAVAIIAYAVLGILIWRLLARWFGEWPAHIGVLVLAYSRITSMFIGGVEAPLLGILLVLFIGQFSRFVEDGQVTQRDWWLLGLLGALVTLTRLDHVIVVAIFLLAAFSFSMRSRNNLRSLIGNTLRLGAFPVILVGGYLLFNEWQYGHFLPISGAIKTSEFLSRSFGSGLRWAMDDKSTLLLLAISPLVLLAALSWFVFLRRRISSLSTILIVWSGANSAYVIFLLLTVAEVGKWYMVSPVLLSVVLFAGAVHRTIQHFLSIRYYLLAATTCGLILLALTSQLKRVRQVNQSDGAYQVHYQFANWCDKNLPANAIIALPDAGLFGYLCSRRVINTDGLVNDWEFTEVARKGQAIELLRRRGVTHLMTSFCCRVWEDSAHTYSYNLCTLSGNQRGNMSFFTRDQILHEQEYLADPKTLRRDIIRLWTFDKQ